MFREFTKDGQAFIIAEVGQNHQGDLDNALNYIEIYAHEGAHAIKFQTRDNKYLFPKMPIMPVIIVKMLLRLLMVRTENILS